MKGMPVAPGRALKSASEACGNRSTLWPLTRISVAMLPTDGTTDTTVSVPRSVSVTTSPFCSAL